MIGVLKTDEGASSVPVSRNLPCEHGFNYPRIRVRSSREASFGVHHNHTTTRTASSGGGEAQAASCETAKRSAPTRKLYARDSGCLALVSWGLCEHQHVLVVVFELTRKREVRLGFYVSH